MSNMKLIMESWRKFELTEEEEASTPTDSAVSPAAEPEAAGESPAAGSWPGSPPKRIAITASSNLSPKQIMDAWESLSSMNPPKDAEKILAGIGGPRALVANVKKLESHFASAASNPARIDMPVVDPSKDLADLKSRLAKGALDVKAPFADLEEVAYDMPQFPTGLDKQPDNVRQRFLTKGLEDGDAEDDKSVSLVTAPIDVDKTYPTQSAVYLDKSLWNILNFGPTEKGGTAFGEPNLIAIRDGGNNYILDGHHRWSSAMISGGPKAKIRVQALTGLDIPTAISSLRAYGNARGNKQKG